MSALDDERRTPRRRVAIVGAGPGGISAAIALHRAGFEVRLFERQPEIKAMGGAVLLSLPVLSILRSYGVDIEGQGRPASFRSFMKAARLSSGGSWSPGTKGSSFAAT